MVDWRDMDKKEKAAAGIQKDSPERLEKKSEITGVSKETLIVWSTHPERIPDDMVDLLIATDEALPHNAMVPLQQGTVIHNLYEIQEVIGQGSFGITYRAWDRLLKRQIALKECFAASICQREGKRVKPADQSQYEAAKLDLLKEARTLARVKHPGVVAVHSVFIDKETDSLFIEMDLLEGASLKKKMSQGRVSHEQAFEWLHTILCALKKVHKKNITHRDIKPANIVFNGDGNPVLIDFGAALNRELKEGTTIAGAYTPRYAAPEQLYPELGKIGPWTDFYSLARTWCELLTGKCDAGDELKLLSGRYPEYQALFLSVKRNLKSDVKKRCQDADEWLDMLRRPVAPAIPEVTVNEIRECIKAVRGCYPKDENVEMPRSEEHTSELQSR